PHKLNVWCTHFSPDGQMIVTTGSDRGVRLWDADTLKPKAALWGHADEVWSAAFSPDGKLLATGSKDQTVRLWSPAASPDPLPLPHAAFARPFFSPDGQRLVTTVETNGGSHSILWDIAKRSRM